MTRRSEQLQIRVTARQKALLERRARAAGLDVSAYVLSRALPDESDRVLGAIRGLPSAQEQTDRRFVLAELNDALEALAPAEFSDAVESAAAGAGVWALTPLLQNYVAAMIEQAARTKGVTPPRWVRDVLPLEEPYFATPLERLRPYLLDVAPVVFKRRNLFVDASIGARV